MQYLYRPSTKNSTTMQTGFYSKQQKYCSQQSHSLRYTQSSAPLTLLPLAVVSAYSNLPDEYPSAQLGSFRRAALVL